jgi:tRNA threonylcarbamoyladenosine biosynthesis protein TsaE
MSKSSGVNSTHQLGDLIKDGLAVESAENDLSTEFKAFFDQLKPQDVVLLSGPIGGGKTTLVRKFIEYKSKNNHVFANSPSYDLVHEYLLSEYIVIHIDLYRIESDEDLESTGFWDVIQQKNTIFFIEWPDRIDFKDIPARSVYDLRIDLNTQSILSRKYIVKKLR